LSGQFAMEQTFIIPVGALVAPEVAPIRVLERLSGRAMA
jgi:3-deoxy-D-manno-octulosonic acid hydroxylase-like protein